MKVFKSILFVLAWLGQLVAVFWAGSHVWKLNMVPLRLFLLGTLVLALLWILEGLLFLSGMRAQKGKHPGLGRRLIAWILVLATVGSCAYGVGFTNKVSETVSTVTGPQNVSTTYAVYVMKDDPAQTLDDAKDYKFGTTASYDTVHTRKAIQELRNYFDGTVELVDHEFVLEMVDALFSGDVDAILLSQGYASIFEDLEGYDTFAEDTRILYDFSVEHDDSEEVPTVDDDDLQGGDVRNNYGTLEAVADITSDPFVVYLSGSDTRNKSLVTSNSDVNILVVVNPKSKQVLLLNTPRDYFVPNPAGRGAMDKLTHCGNYGIGCSASALSGLYKVPVNYYAQINFTGFETLIDAIGGITVYSSKSFKTINGHYIQEGTNNLNGSEALGFVRERHAFASGDRQRGMNQMKAITAVIKKLSSGRNMLLHYDSILSSLQGMFVTSLSADELSSIVKMQLGDNAEWNVQSFAVTGGDGSEITYSIPRMRVYVMYQNPSLVTKASQLVDRVLAGETLTDADVEQ